MLLDSQSNEHTIRRTTVRKCTCWTLVALLVVACPQALSQAPSRDAVASSNRDAIGRPDDSSPETPVFEPRQGTRDFVLPPVARPPAAEAPLSAGVRVLVRSFIVEDNTVFGPDELESAVAPYIGRTIDGEELQAVRRSLTALYAAHGYITSRVLVPDQMIKDGVVRLQAVEGVLSGVEVIGLARLRREYVLARLDLKTHAGPLNLAELESRLRLLKTDPLIAHVNGQLTQGERMNESVLTVEVEESRPYTVAVRIDNHRNPSVGEIQGEIYGTVRNLTGWGDASTLSLRATEGLIDGATRLSLPIAALGPSLELGYRRSHSEVIESPFNAIDIESEFEEILVGVRQSIVRRIDRSLDVTLRLERRHAQTFLLGQPFSFSEGVQNGTSKVTALRLIGDWESRRDDEVLALRTTFSKGIDAFDATINEQAPDGRFFTWLGQLRYARRFGAGNELLLRADAQLSNDALLPLEKFAVGGASSVRGYRENQLVRDNGWSASAELRVPLLRNLPALGRLQGAAFVDLGGAWNEDTTPEPRTIGSAGLGLRWAPTRAVNAELYGAVPFRDVDDDDGGLQDAGLHFRFSYQLF